MTGKVKPQRLKQQINIFFLLQTTEYLPYYKHKCLDSEPSTFLLASRYIIFNKFDKDIVLHRIMIYTGDLPTLYNVCSVHQGVFSTSGGYHEYIGGIP